MSGERKGVGVRLYVAGGQEVRREFADTATSGKRMWSEIASGQAKVNPAMAAFSQATGEVRQGVAGLADNAGAAGRSLAAMGVGGVLAGAAVGGFALALNQARKALDFADEIADTAAKIHVSAEGLQAWRFAAEEAGLEAGAFETSMQSLASAVGKAQTGLRGGKGAAEAFSLIGISQGEIDQVRDLDQLLPQIADGLAGLGSQAERAAVADKLGVRELLPLLEQGAAKIDEMTSAARSMGLVLSNETVASMADMQRQVEVASQVIDVNLKTAFLNLAPVLASLATQLAGFAQQVNAFFNDFKRLDQLGEQGLVDKRARLLSSMMRLSLSPTEAKTDAGRRLADRLRTQYDEAGLLLDEARRSAPQIGTSNLGGLVRVAPSGGGGGKKAGKPDGLQFTPSPPVSAYDLSTGRPMAEKSAADWWAEERFGPETKAAATVDVNVDLSKGIAEAAAGFAEIRKQTADAFSDGFKFVIEGGNIWDLLKRRLTDVASDGFGRVMQALLENMGGGTGAGDGGGWASYAIKAAQFVFGRKAVGGVTAPGEMGSRAEYGPELGLFAKPGQVFDHDQTVRMLRDASGGQAKAASSVVVHYAPTLNAQGAGPREVDQLRADMRRMQAELPGVIVQTVNDGIDRRSIGG